MTLDALLVELFEPGELIRWLASLDKALPRSVNANQDMAGLAFAVAGGTSLVTVLVASSLRSRATVLRDQPA